MYRIHVILWVGIDHLVMWLVTYVQYVIVHIVDVLMLLINVCVWRLILCGAGDLCAVGNCTHCRCLDALNSRRCVETDTKSPAMIFINRNVNIYNCNNKTNVYHQLHIWARARAVPALRTHPSWRRWISESPRSPVTSSTLKWRTTPMKVSSTLLTADLPLILL